MPFFFLNDTLSEFLHALSLFFRFGFNRQKGSTEVGILSTSVPNIQLLLMCLQPIGSETTISYKRNGHSDGALHLFKDYFFYLFLLLWID